MEQVIEFPFAEQVRRPAPEPGSREWAKQHVDRLLAADVELGGLMPAGMAVALLGISNKGLQDLVKRGKVRSLKVPGRCKLVSCSDVYRRLEGFQGRPGRPRKVA